jgi:hypothetical protein
MYSFITCQNPQQRVITPVRCGSGSASFLEADPDSHLSKNPDPHQIEKPDLDPHHFWKPIRIRIEADSDRDPQQSEKSQIRIRIEGNPDLWRLTPEP